MLTIAEVHSDGCRMATSTVWPPHAVAMPMFSNEQIFDQFKRYTSKINVGLNQGIVHSAASIRIKELLFELQIADRHD